MENKKSESLAWKVQEDTDEIQYVGTRQRKNMNASPCLR